MKRGIAAFASGTRTGGPARKFCAPTLQWRVQFSGSAWNRQTSRESFSNPSSVRRPGQRLPLRTLQEADEGAGQGVVGSPVLVGVDQVSDGVLPRS